MIDCVLVAFSALYVLGVDFTRPPEGVLWYLESTAEARLDRSLFSHSCFVEGFIWCPTTAVCLPAETEKPGWIVTETRERDKRALAGRLNKVLLFIVLAYQKASLVSRKRR